MKRIIFSLWILSLVVAVPTIIILPSFFDKYNCKLVNQSIYGQSPDDNPREYFIDLNGDGNFERIETFVQRSNRDVFSFQVFTTRTVSKAPFLRSTTDGNRFLSPKPMTS